MKKFYQYFKDFHKDYFNIWMYLACLLFIAATIVFNYTWPGGNFEDNFIDDKFVSTNLRPFFFFMTHAFVFWGCLFVIWLFRRKKDNIFTPAFFLKSSIAFLLLGVDRSFFVYHELKELVPGPTLLFYYKCVANLSSLLTMFIPLFLFKYLFDRKENFGLYGLRFDKVNFTPYWIMLGLMIPVLYSAITFIPEIQNYYPTYRRTGGLRFANFYHISETAAIAIYESIYISDFIFTELFFRGVLVIGFAKILGKNCVIPMAATYAALHFGKPLGETISSVFGGYILGVIALYSKNIWGGVFVHGGIALFMDLFGIMKMNQ
ncbi:MAG: CPBP family intramembrane glutamic endopeptidase [Chitinophagales bacterium]